MTKFKTLIQHCTTPRQTEILTLLSEGNSYKKVAKLLDINSTGTISNTVKNVERKAKRADLDYSIPHGFGLKKVSTLTKTNELGDKEVMLEWTQATPDAANELAMIQEVTESLCAKFDGIATPLPAPTESLEELLTVYVQTDLHLGQYSSKGETGEEMNLEVVKDRALTAMQMLASTTPKAIQAIVLDLGDTLHAGNNAARTQSGHHLDTDGRHAEAFDAAVELKIAMIDLALQKHEKVKYVIVPGNHSDLVAGYINACLKAYYRNEPRFTIDSSSQIHKYHKHGETLLAFHHGHATPYNRLPEVMVWDRKEDISSTTHRYWLTGHVHKDTVIDNPICRIESFRNLTKNDAWAQGAGYRGHKQAVAITYHTEDGEEVRNIAKIKLNKA